MDSLDYTLFRKEVLEANKGYNFEIITSGENFKIMNVTYDKNFENPIEYHSTLDVAKFLRKLSIEEEVTAWFKQEPTLTGYAVYIEFGLPTEHNKQNTESEGFWFHEDAC